MDKPLTRAEQTKLEMEVGRHKVAMMQLVEKIDKEHQLLRRMFPTLTVHCSLMPPYDVVLVQTMRDGIPVDYLDPASKFPSEELIAKLMLTS